MTAVRALKYIAIFMTILVVVTLLLVGYFFATASVRIVAYGAQTKQCAEDQAEFDQIKAAVKDETFVGTRFSYEEMGEAQDYALITYTVRLSNQCLVPIDMIEIQVVPDPNDVLQLGNNKIHSLNAKTQGEFTATILTPKGSHTVRELLVTYYVWGVSFEIKETYLG